jgi:hypothetical protein
MSGEEFIKSFSRRLVKFYSDVIENTTGKGLGMIINTFSISEKMKA